MEKIWLESYEEGVPAEIDVNWVSSVVDILESSFEKYADNQAFACMGKVITYRELNRLSRNFAAYLQNDLGLQKGDRVALMMPNVLQYPIALFGILRAGLVAVNVNPMYTPRELEHQLNDAGASAIIILSNFAHVLEEVLDKVSLKQVLLTELGDMHSFPKSFILNFVVKHVKKMVPAFNIPNAEKFKSALAKGSCGDYKRPDIQPEDIAFLQYTGGTTGVSKGAVLTHRNITSNVAQALAWIGNNLEEGREIVITPLPLYHIFSLTANCICFSSMGALNVLITNPRDFPGFVNELKKWPFTALTGVNTLFIALLNTPGFDSVDFSHFKVTLGGGMAVQQDAAERWQKVTGCRLIEAYGLTETSPAACINPLTITGFNHSIGVPIPSTEVVLKDDDGKEVPIGERGELCIRGPQVMRGYWNRPEETAKTFFPDGWLRTGDIAIMDEKGFFRIVDRKKNMILVSGFNVFPNEIEDVVVSHPGVLEVAAIGVPDAKSTEAVKLFVVKKDANLTEGDIKDYCKEHLTGYKRPKYIEFRDDLPKSPVGKILHKDLRAEEQAKAAQTVS